MNKPLHKKVQVVVLSESKDEVLLLQTNKDRDCHWQNVTGSVDEGEEFLHAAQRELLEETGLSGKLHLLDLEYSFHDRWKRDIIEKVYVAYCSKKEIILSAEEHQAYKWQQVTKISKDSYGFISNYESFLKAMEFSC